MTTVISKWHTVENTSPNQCHTDQISMNYINIFTTICSNFKCDQPIMDFIAAGYKSHFLVITSFGNCHKINQISEKDVWIWRDNRLLAPNGDSYKTRWLIGIMGRVNNIAFWQLMHNCYKYITLSIKIESTNRAVRSVKWTLKKQFQLYFIK